jgi:hypothetical protein
MNPCKGKKCLKYPICKSLGHVECDIIDQYYKDNNHDRAIVFKSLSELLPNIKSFQTKKSCGSRYKRYYLFMPVTK